MFSFNMIEFCLEQISSHSEKRKDHDRSVKV